MGYTFSMGFDRGNAETNIASINEAGSLEEYAESSAICEGDPVALDNLRRGSDSDDMGMAGNVLAYGGSTYFVGRLALAQGESPTTEFKDKARYYSRLTLVSLLCYSARIALRRHPVNEYEVSVVSGVPYRVYSPEMRERIIEELSGDYHFTYNGRNLTAHVRLEKVLMEGAGAVIAHGTGRNAEARVGVVDFGSLTTNVLAFDGSTAVLPMCGSVEVGTEKVIARLSAQFAHKYGRDLLPREQQAIMRAYTGQRAYPVLYTEHEDTVDMSDLADWTSKALEETASEINTYISRLWGSERGGKVAASFAQVLQVGGGAYYFHEHLGTIIPTSKLSQPEQAERANARGYAARAAQLLYKRIVQTRSA